MWLESGEQDLRLLTHRLDRPDSYYLDAETLTTGTV